MNANQSHRQDTLSTFPISLFCSEVYEAPQAAAAHAPCWETLKTAAALQQTYKYQQESLNTEDIC